MIFGNLHIDNQKKKFATVRNNSIPQGLEQRNLIAQNSETLDIFLVLNSRIRNRCKKSLVLVKKV